jgi:hypothetical protein
VPMAVRTALTTTTSLLMVFPLLDV